jgi:hypothetical protein
MDWILPAVAEAISEVEREAAEAQEDPQAEAYEAHEASTTGGIHESREANADGWPVHFYSLWKVQAGINRRELLERDRLGGEARSRQPEEPRR